MAELTDLEVEISINNVEFQIDEANFEIVFIERFGMSLDEAIEASSDDARHIDVEIREGVVKFVDDFGYYYSARTNGIIQITNLTRQGVIIGPFEHRFACEAISYQNILMMFRERRINIIRQFIEPVPLEKKDRLMADFREWMTDDEDTSNTLFSLIVEYGGIPFIADGSCDLLNVCVERGFATLVDGIIGVVRDNEGDLGAICLTSLRHLRPILPDTPEVDSLSLACFLLNHCVLDTLHIAQIEALANNIPALLLAGSTSGYSKVCSWILDECVVLTTTNPHSEDTS